MPEDEVPAAPFSSGRLSATENGLERVNGSLPTESIRAGVTSRAGDLRKGNGEEVRARRVRTLVPRARYARIGGGHYQQVTCRRTLFQNQPLRSRMVGSITEKIILYSVQSVTSVEPVGTASPLAFQNFRGRPLNRPGSKVMTDRTSQFFLAIFVLAFFCSHRRLSCE